MSGKTRHLCERNGRYFARLVIPRDLRRYLDKRTELRTPLGADRRMAHAKLPSAVAVLQHRIAIAERAATATTGKQVKLGRYPLSGDQIALRNYHERLAFDDLLRNSDSQYASIGIDDQLVAHLREGISGRLPDDQLETLVGARIEYYRHLGNTTVAKGTGEWRTLARRLCVSELEALARVAERDEGDEGDYTGKPENPIIANAKTIEEEKLPVSIKYLFNSYLSELKANGKGAGAEKRWTGVIDDLVRFARSDDANRLTKKTFIDWKDAKLTTLAPRTVKDVYLAARLCCTNQPEAEFSLPFDRVIPRAEFAAFQGR